MMLLLAMFIAMFLCPLPNSQARSAELAELEQQSLDAAVDRVAPSVVQIRTIGGLDRVGKTSIAQGPTTGMIVTENGYIVSSAFNFVQQPSSIVVRLPSGEQVAADLVARDKNRMLVLLKVDTLLPLPVPEAVPRDQLQVGQWAIALGRTFRSDRVGVSVGILSAKNRMYGRVVQTDAKVSVANYGGPLVDIYGRVIGVLTPMSPQAGGENSELAGAEFYDSGIGFAVPLVDVLEILPRFQQGEDLLPGKLGVGLKPGAVHVEAPEITTVWRGSPAAIAGWKPKDVIVAVDGKKVATQAQLRFALKPRYAGDEVTATIRRGEGEDAEQLTSTILLAGELEAYRHAFLGILPERTESSEAERGLEVRGVWPESPAADAGIVAGDRLININGQDISVVREALAAVSGIAPDDTAEIVVLRDDQELSLRARLGTLPSDILAHEDLPETKDDYEEPAEVELQPLKLAEFVQVAKFYAPQQTEKRAQGLLLWLASGKPEEDLQLASRWYRAYGRDDVVLVIAHGKEETGWSGADMEFLSVLVRTANARFDVDPQRTVVYGGGKAGQLAYGLAFARRSSFSGVISLDGPLPRTLKLPTNLPGRRLAVLALATPNSTFAVLIQKNIEELLEGGYATSWWQRPLGDEATPEPGDETLEIIALWLDGLDRF